VGSELDGRIGYVYILFGPYIIVVMYCTVGEYYTYERGRDGDEGGSLCNP